MNEMFMLDFLKEPPAWVLFVIISITVSILIREFIKLINGPIPDLIGLLELFVIFVLGVLLLKSYFSIGLTKYGADEFKWLLLLFLIASFISGALYIIYKIFLKIIDG